MKTIMMKNVQNHFSKLLKNKKKNIGDFSLGLYSSFLKYKKFFKLTAGMFHFPKYKKKIRAGSFYFLSSETYLMKYKKNVRLESSISGNIKIILILEL